MPWNSAGSEFDGIVSGRRSLLGRVVAGVPKPLPQADRVKTSASTA